MRNFSPSGMETIVRLAGEGLEPPLRPRNCNAVRYHELYGVFSNGETVSDDEWTSQMPVLV